MAQMGGPQRAPVHERHWQGMEFKQDSREGPNVLIIEDEALMSALISKYISKAAEDLGGGVFPQTLDSGWDLLTKNLSDVRVSIVDILLPNVNGVDLIRDFRRRYPNMGIIPISGLATEPMKRNLKDLLPPSIKLLPKPLRREDFVEAFVQAWRNGQLAQPPQPVPPSTEEATGEPSWSAVPGDSNHNVPSVRRRLSRRRAA